MHLRVWLCYGTHIEDPGDVAGRHARDHGCETVPVDGRFSIIAAEGSVVCMERHSSRPVRPVQTAVDPAWDGRIRAACEAAGLTCGEIGWLLSGVVL